MDPTLDEMRLKMMGSGAASGQGYAKGGLVEEQKFGAGGVALLKNLATPAAKTAAKSRVPSTPGFSQFLADAPLVRADEASKFEFQTGRPVVVESYSGTRRDFSEIDPGLSSAGYFSSNKPIVANEYAGVFPEGSPGQTFPTGGNIQKSFIRMDNPLYINARGASFNRIDTRGLPGFDLPMSNTDMINLWAKQRGYDGVVYKDLRDSMALPSGQNAPASNVYVSFKPTHVKSAIGNRGTYDIKERDMTKAEGGLVKDPSLDEMRVEMMERGFAGGGLAALKEAVKGATKATKPVVKESLQETIANINKKLADDAVANKTKPIASPTVVTSTVSRSADKIAKANPKLSEAEVAKKAERDAFAKLKWERQDKPELESTFGELERSGYKDPRAKRLRNVPEVVEERARKAEEFLAQPVEPWTPPESGLQAFDRSLIKDALEGFPGIQQTRFPRYEAPRADLRYIDEIYDDPRNRALIEQQIKRGLPLGGETFYASLYPLKVATMERGMPASKFEQFVYETAPASARNSIMNEMAVGQFLRDMKARGLPLDEQTVAQEMANFKSQYGTGLPLMPVHREGVRQVIEGPLNLRDMVIADIPTNYKIPTYGTQKAGDFGKSVVLDVHEAAGQTQASRYHPYFTEQGGFSATEYGPAEAKMLDIAEGLGIPGGMAQAGRWFGGGELTGLKSPRGDALDLLERQAAYTMQGMGIKPTPQNVRNYILDMIETGRGLLMPYFKSENIPDVRVKKKEGGLVKPEGADEFAEQVMKKIANKRASTQDGH